VAALRGSLTAETRLGHIQLQPGPSDEKCWAMMQAASTWAWHFAYRLAASKVGGSRRVEKSSPEHCQSSATPSVRKFAATFVLLTHRCRTSTASSKRLIKADTTETAF